jgi:hypothetical protein
MLDVNFHFKTEGFRRVADAVAPFNLTWLEIDTHDAEAMAFPIIPCNLCGSQENLQRVQMKQMLREWDRQHPGRVDNMFKAMGHIVPSHMMDRKLHPFTTLKATGVAEPGGDRAFDEDEDACAPPPTADAAQVMTLRRLKDEAAS